MPVDHYPLIHIGYHKTGTTWAQRHLFDNADIGFRAPVGEWDMAAHLVEPHALDFDARACQAFFAPYLRAARGAGLMPVMSQERFSGQPHIGGDDSKEIGGRLRAVFPHGRVLIVIREQRDALLSIYRQYVKGNGVWSLREYLQPPMKPGRRAKYATFRREHYRYDRLIRWYIELFGPHNVLVLPFEQLVATPRQFVGAIVRFCGITDKDVSVMSLPYDQRANPSLSGVSVAIKRRLNCLVGQRTPALPFVVCPMPRVDKRVKPLLLAFDRRLPPRLKAAVDQRLAAEVARLVGDYYAESNRKTSALIGVDLACYGYQMDSKGL